MDKYGREYLLNIKTGPTSEIEVKLPFTIEFDIQRNILSSANASSIRVYNLSEKNRNQIYHDFYDYDDLTKSVELRAGYNGSMSVIAKGHISNAWSVREGVNFITQVESFDGWEAFNNSHTSKPYPASTPQKVVIEDLVASLSSEGVTRGAVGNFGKISPRGNSVDGSTTNTINEITDGHFFIDNGKAYCLQDEECVLGEIGIIDSNSGLLGTPVRCEKGITFDMIFEPRLSIGQLIELNSSTGKHFNNRYKVVSLKHRGMISDSVCGNAITTVGLFYGANALTVVT